MFNLDALVDKIGNADLEITYSCNLRCIHCYNPTHENVFLNFSDAKNVLDQLKLLGFQEVHITGGEPLLHKDVSKILEYANSLGLRTVLETNATLLTDKMLDSIKANVSIIRVSLDGVSETHNKIRKTMSEMDVFETATKNLSKAVQLGFKVQVTSSINRINFNQIYNLAKYLNSKSIKNFRIRLTMPSGFSLKQWEFLKLLPEHVEEINNQIEKIKTDFPAMTFKGETLFRGSPGTYLKFFIDPFGNVKPYPFIEEYAGNVLNETVLDILKKIEDLQYPQDVKELENNYLNSLREE
jgi:MoaA/NifB/PqqE/SkfB family radical SAM enzyme